MAEMQIVGPGSGRSLTSYKDELRWRRKLRDAVKAEDLKAELDARRMLNSIFMASQPAQPPEPSTFERFGAGAANLAGGINQLVPPALGGFTPEQEQAFSEGRRLYRQGLPRDVGIDWPAMAGEAAVGAPFVLLPQFRGAASGLLGRTAAGAGSGGAAGGLLFADTPGERLFNVSAGAAGGALGAAALPPIVAAAQTATGRAVPLTLGADAQARAARAARFGYTGDAAPTRGRLTGDPTQIGDELNLAKLPGGERLATRFQQQGLLDTANLERMQGQYGGPTAPAVAAEAVESAVQGRSRNWQTQVRRAYEVARAERPDVAMPGDVLEAATADVLDDFDLPSSVTRRIRNLSGQEGGIAPSELEKLDKLLTDNMGTNRTIDTAMRRLKERVRGVIDEAGDAYGGAYRDAVRAARERFDAMGDMRSLVNQLERGALDPLKAVPRIKGAGIRDLTQLRDFIGQTNPEAWQSLRAAVMTDIAEQATPSGQFSQARYNSAVRKLTPERARVLFGDEGAEELMEFGRVARDLYGPVRGSTANVSNTDITRMRLMDNMFRRILSVVPILGDTVSELGEQAARRTNARAAALALNPSRRVPAQAGGTFPAAIGIGLLGPGALEEARRPQLLR